MTSRLVLNPNLLRKARLTAGLSQRELAERAGIGTATMVRVENGVAAQPSTIRKLAAALGKTPTEIARVVEM